MQYWHSIQYVQKDVETYIQSNPGEPFAFTI